jgi:site-specific recombinase XerD
MSGESPKRIGRGYARDLEADQFQPMIDSWDLHLRAERKSAKTVRTYLEAAQWLAAGYLIPAGLADWDEVKARHVQAWIISLLGRYSDCYANNQFRALQQFFKWYATEDPDEPRANPMASLRPPKIGDKLVPVFTDGELAALLGTCKGGGYQNRRDYAIISMFKDTGARLSELAGLATGDVSPRDREAVVTGKGDKQRTIRFTYETARALDRYQRERAKHKMARAGALWLGVRGPMTASGVYQVIERRGLEAGVEVNPHKFRHTFSHVFQMGRIASDATFPGKRDHEAVGDADRDHHSNADACDSEPAGQDRRVNTDCIRSIDDVPDSVAPGDSMLRLLQRQDRSDEGRCQVRRVATLTYSACGQQCSLPVWTTAGPRVT